MYMVSGKVSKPGYWNYMNFTEGSNLLNKKFYRATIISMFINLYIVSVLLI